METKAKVRICPFCGHHGHKLLYSTVKVRYEDGEIEIQDVWQMECKCCGARGPTEYEPRFAYVLQSCVMYELKLLLSSAMFEFRLFLYSEIPSINSLFSFFT